MHCSVSFSPSFYNVDEAPLNISDDLRMPNILLVEYTVVCVNTPFRLQVLEASYSKEWSS